MSQTALDKDTFAVMLDHAKSCFKQASQWTAAGQSFLEVLPYWPMPLDVAIPHDILPASSAGFVVKYWAGTTDAAQVLRQQLGSAFRIQTWTHGRDGQLHAVGYIPIEDGVSARIIVVLDGPDGILLD
jgi:hypothetical protein